MAKINYTKKQRIRDNEWEKPHLLASPSLIIEKILVPIICPFFRHQINQTTTQHRIEEKNHDTGVDFWGKNHNREAERKLKDFLFFFFRAVFALLNTHIWRTSYIYPIRKSNIFL